MICKKHIQFKGVYVCVRVQEGREREIELSEKKRKRTWRREREEREIGIEDVRKERRMRGKN